MTRMTDAEPHSAKILAAMLIDRAQAIVACMAAALLHFHFKRGKVQLVVKNGHLLNLEFEKAHCFADATTALIHIGRRLKENDLFRPQSPFLGPASKLFLDRAKAMHIGDNIKRHEPHIVAVHHIFRSRIS